LAVATEVRPASEKRAGIFWWQARREWACRMGAEEEEG
jgi:hypothetical protein